MQCQYLSPLGGWRCPEEASGEDDPCIFHHPNINKDAGLLKARLDARLADENEDPLRFDGSIFPDGRSFTRVVFKRSVSFDFAQFHGQVTSFDCAKFRSRETSFGGAQFYGKNTSFGAAQFHGRTIFRGNEPKQVFLEGTTNFESISVEKDGELVFDWVDLSRTRFLRADLLRAKFLDVTWDRPSARKVGSFRWGRWRSCVYDEILWRKERRDPKRRAKVDTEHLSHLG